MRYLRTALAMAVAVAALSGGVRAEDYPVGGSTPDRRPEGAPVITEVIRDQVWYQEALRGITQPFPPNLQFLDNQGNWHTPFNRPGMPGRYDIRGWHRPST